MDIRDDDDGFTENPFEINFFFGFLYMREICLMADLIYVIFLVLFYFLPAF